MEELFIRLENEIHKTLKQYRFTESNIDKAKEQTKEIIKKYIDLYLLYMSINNNNTTIEEPDTQVIEDSIKKYYFFNMLKVIQKKGYLKDYKVSAGSLVGTNGTVDNLQGLSISQIDTVYKEEIQNEGISKTEAAGILAAAKSANAFSSFDKQAIYASYFNVVEGTITRTVQSTIKISAALLNKVPYKIWKTQEDEKVRETHAILDGVEKKVDELFDVGGIPAPAPRSLELYGTVEYYGCRCYLEYKLKKRK